MTPKLKNRFGHNCDIEIEDDEIIIVSQRFDKSGNKPKQRAQTGIPAESFFEQIIMFVMAEVNKSETKGHYFLISGIQEGVKDQKDHYIIISFDFVFVND
jgi:hypothetical protein